MRHIHTLTLALGLAVCALAPAARADIGCDAQCQIARKAQDPLASIRALQTDNTVAYDNERDPLSYGFQLQPVYSLPTQGELNVILRGIVPIVGVRNGVVVPRLGEEPRGGSNYDWGMSDIIVQSFFSPRTDSDLKFGIGPQISLRTRTSDDVAGPGWGAGISAVVTGFSGPWTYGAIVGQHWAEDDYSVASINPVLMYNSGFLGGSYIGYANTTTYSWNAKSSDRWQVPLGVTVGKTFGRADGSAVDTSFGFYNMVERPDGGAESQFKFAISLILP